YTQLQPQRLLLQNQQQPQNPAQNQQQNPQQTQASCKYANDPTTTPTGNNNQSISSPQDLSTRDISPKLSPSSVVENVARSLNKSVVGGGGSGGNVTSTSLSSSLNNNHNTNIPIPMHSPTGDSDSESDSGNEAGSSQNSGNGKKGNPPQIYPWMKRVHIGQSE
uniref:Homeobox domain-containing protein n=1 Tax=Megaselia scalaris TaxID=36166 RepID=T1GZ70_MEGSC